MKSNRQKQRFCHPKMADLKAWSHGVRKANSCRPVALEIYTVLFMEEQSYTHFKKVVGISINHPNAD